LLPKAQQDQLVKMIASLFGEQRSAVEAFIRYLQEQRSRDPKMDIRTALDEFVREHSELLQRLAQ